MSKIKVDIREIINITLGRIHCWCESNVGRIRKENKNVPDHLWNMFNHQKHPFKKVITLSWWERLVFFIKRVLKL